MLSYLLMALLWGLILYVNGGAKHNQLFLCVVAGILWPLTIPIAVMAVFINALSS